eukprot:gb/GEZN01007326.1/.p1 GENE.gb/GEZN01007326.1/~~gb/GEZN01007326.1/.p1  ORF type:complete len:349 (-),score=31.73 gb/GEZN01007326.1/:503-1510(-)
MILSFVVLSSVLAGSLSGLTAVSALASPPRRTLLGKDSRGKDSKSDGKLGKSDGAGKSGNSDGKDGSDGKGGTEAPTSLYPYPVTWYKRNECINCKCPYMMDDQLYTTQFGYPNTRGLRYMETFVTCPGTGTGIFNTLMSNAQPNNGWDFAPDVLMDNYSDEAVAEAYGASFVWMSGIRHWVMDSMRIAFANNIRSLAGVDTRWGANVALGPNETLDNGGSQAYLSNDVNCNRTWFYKAGSEIYILYDPTGLPFVMQSFCWAVDNTLAFSNLPQLGSKLKMPTGWTYATKKITKDLANNGIGQNGTSWLVMQDDLLNTYSACWSLNGKNSCNYQP